MTILLNHHHHRRALVSALLLACYGTNNVSAFTNVPTRYSIQPLTFRRQPHSFTETRVQYTVLNANSVDTIETSKQELTQVLQTNKLETILSYLETNPSIISSLSNTQLQSIFQTIELETANSDDNTVNKRTIEDQTTTQIAFQSVDKIRLEMTKLYRLLRENGKLNVFGSIGRLPPSSLLAVSPPPPEGPIYPTSGSKIITPTLLEEITGMNMIALTPQPTNLLLYGGAILALLEGLASLYYGINFNLLVVCTLLIGLLDQILVSGAVFESILRIVRPEMTQRITKHEAGHFLMAYLLGCPVEGVVLSTWEAISDGRFGGRASAAVSAGTSYYDLDLSEQISGVKPLTRESIDRYSIIVMGGVAAEAVEYGRADGGAGDEDALVRFLRSLNPRSKNAVSAWSPDLIRNQARWGAVQAVLLLKEYKPCYDALVEALERGAELGECIVAIEEAAAREGLGWLRKPLGKVLEGGEHGKWVDIDSVESADISSSGVVSSFAADQTNSIPTYGDDPLTEQQEFLKQYKEVMEKKLQSIDKKLEEMDSKD